jgi:hypothetical protein
MNGAFEIRNIDDRDLPNVVSLLCEGFPRRTAAYWWAALKRLGERERPANSEKYGYTLTTGDVLSGIALTIPSIHIGASGLQQFVNISSWYVRPSHRGRAAKALYNHASGRDGVTYTNLSAAAHTIKTITSFGFQEWTTGQMLALGLTHRRSPSKGPRILTLDQAKSAGLSDAETQVLSDHASFGCIVFCIELADRLSPFIFLRRRIKSVLPCAQLIYCQSLDDLVAHSRAVWCWLAARGFPFMIVDASGPIEGLTGHYVSGKASKYVKGPLPAKAIDHTYSEMVLLGF